MVFLDTNVFLYAAGKEHPLQAPCRGVLRRIEEGTLAANTSVEVVQELLYVLWRRGLSERGSRMARSVMELFPELLGTTRADLGVALELIDRHPRLTPRDAIHAATMRRHGIDIIISADVHFDRVEGIQRIDPSLVEDVKRSGP